jgi:DNA-binding NarL/FixJ family response regulator
MPKVLIVDDHAFIRRGVQNILQSVPEWEFSGEADNGNEAIRLAEEVRPEVVIMDVSMPGLNGVEAARQIRQRHPSMKILLLTLHESSELATAAFRAGVNGYLLKSDAEQELVRALKEVLAGGTYVSPRFDSNMVKRILQGSNGTGPAARSDHGSGFGQ